MSIKDEYYVERINPLDTKEWILQKHYAKKFVNIVYAFGLLDKNKQLKGVCTFGTPSSASMNSKNAFTSKLNFRVLELNRLVLECENKNSASFLISQCLKQIPESCLIVSYADPNNGHHGYIYQATNWIYTGLGGDRIEVTNKYGKRVHTKTLSDQGIRSQNDMIKNGYIIKEIEQKFRYFNVSGNKKDKNIMLKALKYPILPYPKGENKRYDASYQPTIQGRLF